jgi:chemotaxis protein methyltransferase WspC
VPTVLPQWVREPVPAASPPAVKGGGSRSAAPPVGVGPNAVNMAPASPGVVNSTAAYDAAAQSAKPTVELAAHDWIAEAQQLANQGKLREALQVCEVNMEAEVQSAQGYCLMGVLHDAAGRTLEAIKNYRRALYLDPTHQEALVHLGTALMREGDAQGAQRLFDRAKRAEGGG